MAKAKVAWERSKSFDGPWEATRRVPAGVLTRAKKLVRDLTGKLVPKHKPGEPLAAQRYFYRYRLNG
jgi:hypothetical protein